MSNVVYLDFNIFFEEIQKNEVDYERDLNSILPNLFISIKFCNYQLTFDKNKKELI